MIPSWTMSGVVPAIRPGVDGGHQDRSPYLVKLDQFISQYAFTQERAIVLNGFLNYRAALHDQGLVSGFQWLNGSFLEHIEDTESRAPRDIDVVTFFHLPEGQTQISLFPAIRDLFDTRLCKATYHVDGYPHMLGTLSEEREIRQTCYWYSMWSHRRDGVWKGFAQVDLDPAGDKYCAELLQQISTAGFS